MRFMLRCLIRAALVGLSGYLLFLPCLNEGLMREYFSKGTYFIILFLFLYWLCSWIQYLRTRQEDFRAALSRSWKGALFCAVLVTVIFVSVKPYFRVLADETNLLSVSKTMTYEKRIDNVTMGKWYYFNYHPLARKPPKRPLLFPFITHLIHTVSGVRPQSPIAANFMILFFLFISIFYLFQKHYGALWGYLAVLAVAAQPVISQAATSAGYDLLQAFLILLAFILLKSFLRSPSLQGFNLLWIHLVLLAHARHESALFFVIIITALIFFGYFKFDYLRSSYLYYLTPLFLMPLFWQLWIRMFVSRNTFETPGEGIPPFAWDYLVKHTEAFFRTFFRTDFYAPHAQILDFLGMLAMGYLFYLFIRKQWARQRWERLLLSISILCVICLWGVVHAYHIAPDHPSNSRLFATFAMILSLLAIMMLARLRFLNQRPGVPVVFVLGCFILYHPISVQNRFLNSQTLPRQYRHVMDFIDHLGHREFLLITSRPGLYAARDYGAVSFAYARRHQDRILKDLGRHLYRDIYVVQSVRYATKKPRKGEQLGPGFRLEALAEIQDRAASFVRISRVMRVKGSPCPARA